MLILVISLMFSGLLTPARVAAGGYAIRIIETVKARVILRLMTVDNRG